MNQVTRARKLSQSFELVPIGTRPGAARQSPYLRLQVRPGKTGPSATIKVSSAARDLLGINLAEKSGHVQVYLSTLGIKLVKCRVDSDFARKLNVDGKFVTYELIDMLGLEEGDVWDCDVYASESSADGRATRSIIGSFPAALRDKLNGLS